MRAKGMAALAAFCFIALVAFPMSGADAGSSDGYSSQLDADGQLVYSQVAGALEAVQADPVNTVGVSVDLRDALVLFESTEDAEAYARETVRTALAAMYYEDPMAVWLWDLPVKDVEVEVSTGPVTTKLTDSGYEKVYFAATGVSFTLSVPEDMADDPATEQNELADRMDSVRKAAAAISVGGSVSEKVKAIADRLHGVRDSADEEGQVSNAYDALVVSQSSSAGIAAAFNYVCQLNGVEVMTVRGTVCDYKDGSTGSTGYWNVVRDGDSWYGVDVSWYDGDDRSPLMAGYGTETPESNGERFGATHVADLDMTSGNSLVPVAISAEGYSWPDDRTFMEKWGTHVFAVIIVAVIVGVFVYAIRKGNI